MLLKRTCVVLCTIFGTIIYDASAEDTKAITFTISHNKKCAAAVPQLTVGDQLAIAVSFTGKNLHRIARCTESQASQSLVMTTFRNLSAYSHTTVNKLNVTQTGDLNYKCTFYFHKCEFQWGDNVCWYKPNKWGWDKDKGVTCSTRVKNIEVVKPSGYLTASGVYFNSSGEYTLEYHAGDNVNFTCHKTAGTLVKLLYTGKDYQNVTNAKVSGYSSMALALGEAHNDSTLDCIIATDKDHKITITLKFLIIHDALRVNILWIIVSAVVIVAFLLATALWLILHRKSKKSPNNKLPDVHYQNIPSHQEPTSFVDGTNEETYAEPYSLNTYQKTTNAQGGNEHTYQNSDQLNNEPTYAAVGNSEPACADNNEPAFAAVHNIEPNFASVKSIELNFGSAKTCAEKWKDSTLVHKPNLPFINQSLILDQKAKLKIKDKRVDDNKKISLAGNGKNRIDLNGEELKTRIKESPNLNDEKHKINRPESPNLNAEGHKTTKEDDEDGEGDNTKTTESTNLNGQGHKIKRPESPNLNSEGRRRPENPKINGEGDKIRRSESPELGCLTYADLLHKNENAPPFIAPKPLLYSDINQCNIINQYENADVKNDVEPAYCEIIPTKQ